jgi:hypothetical protein
MRTVLEEGSKGERPQLDSRLVYGFGYLAATQGRIQRAETLVLRRCLVHGVSCLTLIPNSVGFIYHAVMREIKLLLAFMHLGRDK